MYGWVGPGSYAPYNIPNIFKAAGLNTRWIPEVNPIFQVGLLYPQASPAQPPAPSPSLSNQISSGYSSSVKVKKSIPHSQYKQPQVPNKAILSSPVVEQPAIPPPYSGPSTYVQSTTTRPTTTTSRTTTTITRRPVSRTITPFVNLRGSPSPSYDGKN